mmetsp:Transcript_9215/g.12668  ORF Transcript_9215/g.12668 Transcript_9215/m.12668 type:complete len:359 (-) Transcript_9215:47-1123(-)
MSSPVLERILDCTVDTNVPFEKVTESVRYLTRQFVTAWRNLNDTELLVKQLTGGVTNKLYRCKVQEDGYSKVKGEFDERFVLVRVYGNNTDIFIDRKEELENIERLHKLGFAPKLYGCFNNGFIYGYFKGKDISPTELYEMKYSDRIAAKLADWHSLEFPGEKVPSVWPRIEKWLNSVPAPYKDPVKQKQLDDYGGLEKLKKEYAYLKQILSSSKSPIVFCHNDLLGPNIIYDSETDTFNFIDYEYGSYNYRGFDFGNHFNEYAGFELDYAKYPSKEQQYIFFKQYLKAFKKGVEPTEQELHDLYVESNQFSLTSHFFWSVWALVQAEISDIDFPYMQYAIDRFKRYYETKDQFLALK